MASKSAKSLYLHISAISCFNPISINVITSCSMCWVYFPLIICFISVRIRRMRGNRKIVVYWKCWKNIWMFMVAIICFLIIWPRLIFWRSISGATIRRISARAISSIRTISRELSLFVTSLRTTFSKLLHKGLKNSSNPSVPPNHNHKQSPPKNTSPPTKT